MKTKYFTLCLLFFVSVCACRKNDSSKPAVITGKSLTAADAACNAQLADVENIAIFPADNSWNQDISAAPVDPNNKQIITRIMSSHLKADFGSGLWQGAPIGIPFVVVCGSQPKAKVTFRANAYDGNYGSESDQAPYAIPLNAPIEGNGQGDSHVIAVDKDNKILYELYNASVNNGKWEASSGAIFNLTSDKLRPIGWTSADAAGLAILPGLVRYDEVLKGVIDHAIRFTLSSSNIRPGFISPARHHVNSTGGQYSLDFGCKLRLKAGFVISGYPTNVRIILKAMKKYGIILADVGSNMYFSGAPDSRWNNDELQTFGNITAGDFEVVNYH